EARAGIYFYDKRTFMRTEHINSCNTQFQFLCCQDCGMLLLLRKLDDCTFSSPVKIGAEFSVCALPFNGADNLSVHHKCPDVCTVRFPAQFLDQDICVQSVKSFDHRFGCLQRIDQDNTYPLRSFQELYDHRCASHILDKLIYVLRLVRKYCFGNSEPRLKE